MPSNSKDRALQVFINHWLDDMMAEREAHLLRVGQLERVLIRYRRLQSRTKEKGDHGPVALDILEGS